MKTYIFPKNEKEWFRFREKKFQLDTNTEIGPWFRFPIPKQNFGRTLKTAEWISIAQLFYASRVCLELWILYLFISGNRSLAIRFVVMLWVRSATQSTFLVCAITFKVTAQFWWNWRNNWTSSSLSNSKSSQTASLFFSEKKSWPKFPVSIILQIKI